VVEVVAVEHLTQLLLGVAETVDSPEGEPVAVEQAKPLMAGLEEPEEPEPLS
jgi:hypothetical protein